MNNNVFSGLCRATGIGSVPHTDIDLICDFILKTFPDMPYWPQAVNTDPLEGMMVQYAENLPCLKVDRTEFRTVYDGTDRENEILKFYENLTQKNYDYFKISSNCARGFYALLDKCRDTDLKFIKGHVLGPVTFLYSVNDSGGKSILYDETLSDAIIRGLAMKAVWQAKEIEKIGKSSILFFDEPGMTAFGSGFMALNREQALSVFNRLVDTVREYAETIIGIHCCGNSDWGMLLETDIDIISYDAFSFSDNFLLFHENIKKFLQRGGIIAWGIVPTTEFYKGIDIKIISNKFNEIITYLEKKGISREMIIKNSVFTPACGTGTLNEQTAEQILTLTHDSASELLY